MQIAAGFFRRNVSAAMGFISIPCICDTVVMRGLNTFSAQWPTEIAAWAQAKVDGYLEQMRQLDAGFAASATESQLVCRAFVASEFLREEASRRPLEFWAVLSALDNVPQWQECVGESAEEFSARLRRFRRLCSVALILRDLAGIDDVAATLSGASRVAEVCIQVALHHVEQQMQSRFGVPRSGSGEAQQLVVIAMGKLGGGELNFSSDVDLILAFPEAGECDGARALANEEYFTRLGQRLAQVLGDVTQEGFVLRVDYRLRPYGSAGRIALSFNAMEQYYQREGRDWERYAWIKARAVAGNLAAGARLIEMLRPFVYRRYLDFTAIEGLRDLKSRIDLEVDRQDLAENLKLGPGGIRELEFAVQLAQLIRGGREITLRVSGFLDALAALHRNGQFDAAFAEHLRTLYLFLRRIENRVQMYADKQTHALPSDEIEATRIALTLEFGGLVQLKAHIASVRSEVQALFARTLDAPEDSKGQLRSESDVLPSSAMFAGFSTDVKDATTQLLSSLPVRRLDMRARERFERALPLLMSAAQATITPDLAALRLLRLMHSVAGRPSYLALLAERRAARERVADVFARSAFLAERVIAHPLLLDDLLDSRIEDEAVDSAEIASLFARSLARAGKDDVEAELAALHEARQSAMFRTALAWANRRLRAPATAAMLASIAELCVRHVLSLAQRDLVAQCGEFPDALLVVAYGSFGGAELGFGSDLDLVFLFDPEVAGRTSTGPRPLEGGRYMARLSQRVLHWLSTPTHAGSLYEVDVRLRPDGAKGLLVSPLNAFRDYQLHRAWVWEHQALLRARVVAGPDSLRLSFDRIRNEVLGTVRHASEVRQQVGRMRARWRSELDRSDVHRFDLKQGRGGLVDIEFLLQGLVLMYAHEHPALLGATTTPGLIDALMSAGVIEQADGRLLGRAHAGWLESALDCALNARPRMIDRCAEVDELAASVSDMIKRAGFEDRAIVNEG